MRFGLCLRQEFMKLYVVVQKVVIVVMAVVLVVLVQEHKQISV
jgi:hypothetical protein